MPRLTSHGIAGLTSHGIRRASTLRQYVEPRSGRSRTTQATDRLMAGATADAAPWSITLGRRGSYEDEFRRETGRTTMAGRGSTRRYRRAPAIPFHPRRAPSSTARAYKLIPRTFSSIVSGCRSEGTARSSQSARSQVRQVEPTAMVPSTFARS